MSDADPYVAPLSSDAVIRQTRRLIEFLTETQRELEQYVVDLERQVKRQPPWGHAHE